MKKPTFSVAVMVLACLSLFTSLVFGQAPVRKGFGKGNPFIVGELPAGKLKDKLLVLNPKAREKAMVWLHTFNFDATDAAEHLRVDNGGGVFMVCPDGQGNYEGRSNKVVLSAAGTGSTVATGSITAAPVTTTGKLQPAAAPVVANAVVPVSSPPAYHSRPSATRHIYLDFNGGIVTGTDWNTSSGVASYSVKSWTMDWDPTTFNDVEQVWMLEVWQRVSEDFAPFDVDVTTDVAYDPDNYTGNRNNVGWILICDTIDNNGVALPHNGSGGVAYVGVFGDPDYAPTYQPAWVTSTNGGGTASIIAEAASHEMGHNMGLSHDGTSTLAYYGGHGTGDISWGPIMGTGYYRNVSQWSKGEYYHANNLEDDLAIMSGRIPYRSDDHGNTMNGATPLVITNGNTIVSTTPEGDPANSNPSNKGVIETNTDVDVFSFKTGAGNVVLNVNPWKQPLGTFGGNLDVAIELHDSTGALVASNNPVANTYASISATLAAGTYYLFVTNSGAGNPLSSTPTGYTSYGSIGQYFISGTIEDVVPTLRVSSITPATAVAGTASAPVNLTGTFFQSGATIRLRKAASPDIVGNPVVFTSGTAMSCVFNLTGVDIGVWDVVVTNPDTTTGTLPGAFTVTVPVSTLFAENFDAASALPTGWATSGTNAWGISNASSQTPNQSASIIGPSTVATGYLSSPAIAIPVSAKGLQLSFWHSYNLESWYDGAQIQLSLDGGAWFGINDSGSGATFAANGYNATISTKDSSSIAGQSAWSGNSGGFIQTIVNLTDSVKYDGKSLRVRWLLASDYGTASAGWYVDTVQLVANVAGDTLVVTPSGYLAASGNFGGAFSPSSQNYTVTNTGTASIAWTATKTAAWVTLSSAGGTLAAGASAKVTVSINSSANTLARGGYRDTVTFTNATNGNGNANRSVILTVNAMPVTVTLGNLTQTYNGSPKPVTVTTGPTPITYSVTYAGSSTVPTNAGTYAVVATVTQPNYTGSASGSLVIAKAAQTITFGALANVFDNAGPFKLGAAATSGLTVSYASSNPAVATVSGNNVIVVGPGNTTITASQAGGSNYNAATSVLQSLTVDRTHPPAITSQPVAITINSGSTATFTVVASGTSPNYQWYQGPSGVTSKPLAGATGSSFTTPALSATTSYWIRVSNAAGTAASNTATATVITPPAIITQPVSTTINSGSTATFTVVVSGTSPSYQWYEGASGVTSKPLVGATGSSFTTPGLSAITSYWIQVSNAAGTAASNTVTATVITPPAITSQPVSTTINSGSTATFTVSASGTSPSYQWYEGASGVTSKPLVGATGSSFTTPALSATTRYWIQVSNAAGTAASNTVTTTVITPPAITSQPVSTTINSGGAATFTVVASGTSPIYQWYEGASGVTSKPLVGATGSSFITPALSATTSYWIQVSNAAGTAASNTVTATVITPPAITSQPVSTTINNGGTATFTVVASGTAPSYQWYEGASGVTSKPLVGATGSSFTTPALSASTRYWIQVSNAAGTAASNTVTATVITPPAITSQPVSTTINSGGTATFTVVTSGTSPSYQWYEGASGVTSKPLVGATGSSFTTPALSATTRYWIQVSNAAGTAASNTVTATVITPPAINSQPVSTTINSGGTATFTVVTSGTSPSYQWYEGASGVTSKPLVGATGSSFTTPALSATTRYWIQVSNAAGTAASNTVTATVITPPAITSQPVSTTINSGGTATFTVVASGTSPSYQWYEGGSGVTSKPFVGATDASFTTPALIGVTSYWVRVSNAAGTADSNTVTVSIYSFALTTSGAHGAVTGVGNYDGMTSALVLAVPDPGYYFSGWTGDASGTANPLSLLMDSNKNVVAIFATPFDYCFVGKSFEPRIGNTITLDLKKLITPGQTIELIGKLPAGLEFSADTGLLTGTLTGKPGVYQIDVRILEGKTIVRSVPLSVTVLDFPSSLIGSFDGILEDADGVAVGAFRLTITGPDTWTATLEAAGDSIRRAKGSFVLGEGAPSAPINAVFAAAKGVPEVIVHTTIDGNSPTFAGSYNHGTVRGFRLASGAELPPATVAYNLVLDAGIQDGITIPAGLGWLKGSVGKTGVGKFKGLLGDGAYASITLRLSPSGQAVLWAQPYANKNSYIGGIVTLNHLGQPASDNATLNDSVWWLKSADAKALSYPNGFAALPVTLGTSRWVAPATATALGASLGWRNDRTAAVTLDGAGISNQSPQATIAQLPTEFTIDDKFNLLISAPLGSPWIAWSGKITKADGAFTGVLKIPAGFSSNLGSGTASASGVLLQDEPWGAVTGCGLIKVPVSGPKGSFRTAAMVLDQ